MSVIGHDVGSDGIGSEARKLAAFMRRDFLIAWSYRATFVADLLGLGVAVVSFYFVGLMVDPAVLPAFGGERATYMEFVAVGLVFGLFVSIGLTRIGGALRTEQLMGTLESVLLTPTSTTTIQLGSVVYELAYLPVRTVLFFGLVAVTMGLDINLSGVAPAAVAFLVFVPFVWGLGVLSAAAAITARRAGTGLGIFIGLATLFSGAYFPAQLLPGWLEATVAFNPIGVALQALRETLLGNAGLGDIARELAVLAPYSLGMLAVGLAAFKLALRRERRRGNLGLY